jgi:hypothetical protein
MAGQECRQLSNGGIGKGTIWRDVNGQSGLGEDDLVEGLIPHIMKYQDIPEKPRSHRYVNRLSLEKIFPKNVNLDNRKRE